MHGLFIAGLPVFELLAETFRLVVGIIQLRKAVGDFAPAQKQLEPIGHLGIIVVAPGQGRDLRREGRDIHRLHQPGFHRLLENFQLYLAQTEFLFQGYMQFTGHSPDPVELLQSIRFNLGIKM